MRIYAFKDNDVRVRGDEDGELWFVASDVCDCLGLVNVTRTLQRLRDDEKSFDTIETPGGKQRMRVINESGLYSLVLTSRKPEAKRFQRWVTHEVLPSIRKTGSYSVDDEGGVEDVIYPMGHVYFIRQMKTDFVKIGFTKTDPAQRLSALQTGNPEKLELVATVPAYHRLVECRFHRRLADKRVRGEWFELTAHELSRIANPVWARVNGLSLNWEERAALDLLRENRPSLLEEVKNHF